MSVVKIYTDGSTINNPGPSGIGVYITWKKYNKSICEHIGIGTNNMAELMAIKAGLSILIRKDLPIRVFTDSWYCIGVLQIGWKAKANLELIMSIKSIMNHFNDIKLIKVKAHSGIIGNEIANSLARSANNNK